MKKFFKKYTPDKDLIENNRYLSILGKSIFHKELWKFNRDSFSRAAVIGIFWAWMPMFFQMIPAAYCAVLFRANLPLSVAGVWISNPITMPPMMYFAYLFGNTVLNQNPIYEEFHVSMDWIMGAMGNIWEPLIVGTMIIGIASSVIGYIVMNLMFKLYFYQKLKKRKLR